MLISILVQRVRAFSSTTISFTTSLQPGLLPIDVSSIYLLNSLGWDDLLVRRAKQKAYLMYKRINYLAPASLCDLFAPRTPNYYFAKKEEY